MLKREVPLKVNTTKVPLKRKRLKSVENGLEKKKRKLTISLSRGKNKNVTTPNPSIVKTKPELEKPEVPLTPMSPEQNPMPSEEVIFQFIRNGDEIYDVETKIAVLECLCSVKNVYCLMLPNMPKDYTTRLVFDRKHISLIGSYKGDIICGITFRPFPEQGYIEIAFVAVNSKYQIRGIGSRMMSQLKNFCQKKGYFRMLTCADNHAVGYFKKQGFSEYITISRRRFEGYIKSYDSVTLMECIIRPYVDYTEVRNLLESQREVVQRNLNDLAKKVKVYKGLDLWKKNMRPKKIEDIPGIQDSGWKKPNVDPKSLKDKLKKIVRYMQKIPDAWPFLKPVEVNDVPDYYFHIKFPMDLKTLSQNVKTNKYSENTKQFHKDMIRIFENCRIYNPKGSVYYKCANDCQKRYYDFIKRSKINLFYYFESDNEN